MWKNAKVCAGGRMLKKINPQNRERSQKSEHSCLRVHTGLEFGGRLQNRRRKFVLKSLITQPNK